jgi:hypothetical protein
VLAVPRPATLDTDQNGAPGVEVGDLGIGGQGQRVMRRRDGTAPSCPTAA